MQSNIKELIDNNKKEDIRKYLYSSNNKLSLTLLQTYYNYSRAKNKFEIAEVLEEYYAAKVNEGYRLGYFLAIGITSLVVFNDIISNKSFDDFIIKTYNYGFLLKAFQDNINPLRNDLFNVINSNPVIFIATYAAALITPIILHKFYYSSSQDNGNDLNHNYKFNIALNIAAIAGFSLQIKRVSCI